MNDNDYATRERSMRDRAAARGMRLEKSRCRTPEVPVYGTYRLVGAYTGNLVAGDVQNGYGLTLNEIEKALDGK